MHNTQPSPLIIDKCPKNVYLEVIYFNTKFLIAAFTDLNNIPSIHINVNDSRKKRILVVSLKSGQRYEWLAYDVKEEK